MLFSDVIGQANVKRQLKRMLDENRVPHAMLFAGNEGKFLRVKSEKQPFLVKYYLIL